MTEFEHLVETRAVTPDYSNVTFTEDELAAGAHRRFIGGAFDTHGLTQVDYLKGVGLVPGHRFLDVGCGSLRAGRHFVDYLDPGNYWGVDANTDLVRAGYDRELTDEQRAKLPVANLRINDRFNVDFGVQFDMAIAQSIFSHVSLNHVRLCLVRVARVMRPGGRFYVTFFVQPERVPVDKIVSGAGKGNKPHMTERNVFWYYRRDLEWAASFAPWKFTYIGDWGHPRGQMLVELTKLPDGPDLRPADRARKVARWARRRAAGFIAP